MASFTQTGLAVYITCLAIIGPALLLTLIQTTRFIFHLRSRSSWSTILKNKFVAIVLTLGVAIVVGCCLMLAYYYLLLGSPGHKAAEIVICISMVVSFNTAIMCHMWALYIRTDVSIISPFWFNVAKFFLYSFSASVFVNVATTAGTVLGMKWETIEFVSGSLVGITMVLCDAVYMTSFYAYVRNTKHMFGQRSTEVTSIIAAEGVKLAFVSLVGATIGCFTLPSLIPDPVLLMGLTAITRLAGAVICILWMEMKIKIDKVEKSKSMARLVETSSVPNISSAATESA
jgi:hypothetical protein